jgi:hypothetical protein
MSTVQKITAAVQQLRNAYISKVKTHRFTTGVRALALHESTSLNAAGRRLGPNRWTGESRIRRTVTDEKLGNQVQRLLVAENLASRKGWLYCSLGHSQSGPFCIAVLAVSVRKGRAIPVWCQVNQSEAALEALFASVAATAPKLKLVLVCQRPAVQTLCQVRDLLHCQNQGRQIGAAALGSELVARTDSRHQSRGAYSHTAKPNLGSSAPISKTA